MKLSLKDSRFDLDCDFNYHLIQRYAKMCRENEPVAEAFVYYISDVFDESDNMSDSELRRKMNYGCNGIFICHVIKSIIIYPNMFLL